MLKICRISFSDDSGQKIILKELKNKTTFYDNRLKLFTNNIQWGNNCICGVLEDKAKELINKYPKIFIIDMKNYLITKDDLLGLKTGDKITLNIYDELNPIEANKEKGTITEINNDVYTIRKYKCKNKGWFIYPNCIGQIEVGW